MVRFLKMAMAVGFHLRACVLARARARVCVCVCYKCEIILVYCTATLLSFPLTGEWLIQPVVPYLACIRLMFYLIRIISSTAV